MINRFISKIKESFLEKERKNKIIDIESEEAIKTGIVFAYGEGEIIDDCEAEKLSKSLIINPKNTFDKNNVDKEKIINFEELFIKNRKENDASFIKIDENAVELVGLNEKKYDLKDMKYIFVYTNIIPNKDMLSSRQEVIEKMEKGEKYIYTTCLEFFSFYTIEYKNYDVILLNISAGSICCGSLLNGETICEDYYSLKGSYISVAELFFKRDTVDPEKEVYYTDKDIKITNDIRKLYLGNHFEGKERSFTKKFVYKFPPIVFFRNFKFIDVDRAKIPEPNFCMKMELKDINWNSEYFFENKIIGINPGRLRAVPVEKRKPTMLGLFETKVKEIEFFKVENFIKINGV